MYYTKCFILGDPGADSGGEGKSKRVEKCGTNKSKERREASSVAAVLPSDWAEKHNSFLAPIRSQNGGDRLELVWKDIVPRGSCRRSLLFFVPYFSDRLDFPLPPLAAPKSPRMGKKSPLGQCLTRPVPNGRRRSDF